jgi:hypothetical protein
MRITAAGLALLLASGCGPSGTIGNGTGDDDGTGTPDAAPFHPGADGGGPSEFADAAVCDQTTPITVTQSPPPDLLIVLDKSGSMGDPLNGGLPKWLVMQQALTSVIDMHATTIRFGLETFPSDDTCGAGWVGAGVGSDPGTLKTLLQLTLPGGATPIPPSLDAARSYYAGQPINMAGRFVLLATDGQSNCGGGDPNTVSSSEAITAAAALSAAGIKVFVLGFGDPATTDPATLQAMAQMGGTGMPYQANSPAQLDAALAAIAGQVAVPPCTFQLAATPGDASLLGVTFDGAAVPRNPSHQSGWDYDPATNSITFYGATCIKLQSGSVSSVHVDYGCGGPVIG